MVAQSNINAWIESHPIIREMIALEEVAWFNPSVRPVAESLSDVGLTQADVDDASARLTRFAPLIARAFPNTAKSNGIIESPIQAIPTFQKAFFERAHVELPGHLWLKLDHQLPISGSIKARGGIYEVLKHAENLALDRGLLRQTDDYSMLDSDDFRIFFSHFRIAVGSTGNLGLSIGIMGATLGFKVSVHMSADAREWKKAKLRSYGVDVIEHASDYSVAVAEGRRLAEQDPSCYFIDDENSPNLFLGYAVAAERLKQQFDEKGVVVDKNNPLFVYLPCGVGGGPGGVAFGLKLAFGDFVHCVFAEPTHSPCMLLGIYTGLHDDVSVQDFGIDNITAADGLAVGRPSRFVGKAMQRMIDGYYTVQDAELYALLALLEQKENIRLEPSALAGFPGIRWVNSVAQKDYRCRMQLSPEIMANATHLAWATGGSMVPQEEMNRYLAKGRQVLKN